MLPTFSARSVVNMERVRPMAASRDISWRTLEQFSFGDSAALADELANLVLAGKKRATCWAASEGA